MINQLCLMVPCTFVLAPVSVTYILLEVEKYAPDESPKWRRVNARFPDLYKALLAKTDVATRGARLREAVSAVG